MYAEKERKFVFKSVIVGQTSKARFKISNPNKVLVYCRQPHSVSLLRSSIGKTDGSCMPFSLHTNMPSAWVGIQRVIDYK